MRGGVTVASANTIRVDYDGLAKAAQVFDTEAEHIVAVRNQLRQQLTQFRAGWEGPAADTFFDHMDADILPGLARLIAAMTQGGETTRHMAHIFAKAEEEAADFDWSQGPATQGKADLLAGDHHDQGLNGDAGFHLARFEPGAGGGSDGRPSRPLKYPGDVEHKNIDAPRRQTPMEILQEIAASYGLEIPEGTELTACEVAALIDLILNNTGAIVLDGLSFEETLEVAQIAARAKSLGLQIGMLNRGNPIPWTLDDLRHINTSIDSMTGAVRDQFIAMYGEQALVELAYSMGLPPERVGDAALALLIGGGGERTRTLALDEGVYVRDRGQPTVAYRFVEGGYLLDRVHAHATPEGQVRFVYDPSTDPPRYVGALGTSDERARQAFASALAMGNLTDANSRPAVYYARASDEGVIVNEHVLKSSSRDDFFRGTYGEFTLAGLIAHEVGHLIDFSNRNSADLLGNPNLIAGLRHNARSANNADELRADLIANGLLGELSSTSATNFDNYVGQVLTNAHDAYTANTQGGDPPPHEYYEQAGYEPPQPEPPTPQT